MRGRDWWEGFDENAPLRAMRGIDWWEGFDESAPLKVHKIEIFFGFDFEICIISFLVMSKY